MVDTRDEDIATCEACGSSRFRIHARNLCTRCYPLVRKKEKAIAWDLSKSESLEDCPISFAKNPNEFQELKSIYLEIVDERVEYLKHVESTINDLSATGLAIEYQLMRIAERAGVREPESITHGAATILNDHIDAFGKTYLYSLLAGIEESLRWDGLSLAIILERRRMKSTI